MNSVEQGEPDRPRELGEVRPRAAGGVPAAGCRGPRRDVAPGRQRRRSNRADRAAFSASSTRSAVQSVAVQGTRSHTRGASGMHHHDTSPTPTTTSPPTSSWSTTATSTPPTRTPRQQPGPVRVWRDWTPASVSLSPTRYFYELPSSRRRHDSFASSSSVSAFEMVAQPTQALAWPVAAPSPSYVGVGSSDLLISGHILGHELLH